MGVTPQEQTIGGRKLTYADLATLTDESKRYEILDGELAVTPSPTTKHQRVSAKLGTLLCTHVWAHGLGEVFYAPTDVMLDDHTVVVPDLLFVSAPRTHIIKPHAIVGPPDLAIEILSPTTTRRDKGIKATLYARFGVAHYWLVDPVENVLEMFRLPDTAPGTRAYASIGRHAGDAVAATELFPGLVLDLAGVWQ